VEELSDQASPEEMIAALGRRRRGESPG